LQIFGISNLSPTCDKHKHFKYGKMKHHLDTNFCCLWNSRPCD